MSFKNSVYFILVEPQMGENIGAVARCISNFGFENLRIVNPRDGWPNQKAIDNAAHGSFVIDNAQIFTNLNDAVADLNYVTASTANIRDMEKPVYSSREFAKQFVDNYDGRKIGVLLGRERSGLTNEEIVIADSIITIATDDKNPSINLAQASCIIAYELSQCDIRINTHRTIDMATKAELNFFLNLLFDSLETRDYFKVAEKKKKMKQNICNIFAKANLTKQEIQTLNGIIRGIQS